METELTRRYQLPIPLSATAAVQYRQYINSSTAGSPLRDIPEAHDLSSIKEELERMAADPEARLERLKRDLNHLVQNVRVYESTDANQRPTKGGKDINAVMERFRIQKEERQLSDDKGLRHHSSRQSKSQSDRQAALETLRRRHRRDEQDDGYDSDRRRKTTDAWSSAAADAPRKMANDRHHGKAHPSRVKSHELESLPTPTSYDAGQPESPSEDAAVKLVKMENMSPAPAEHGHEQHGKKRNRPQPSRPQTTHTKRAIPPNSNDDQELDFVRVKPKDQVPLATFYAAMEPYFRPLTEEDREFLKAKGDDATPYVIPPLGRYYLDNWAEEDGALNGGSSQPSTPTPQHHFYTSSQRYLHPSGKLTESHLLEEHLTCGSLTERLISSLIPEHSANDNDTTHTVPKDPMEEDEDNESDSQKEEDDVAELCTSPPQDMLAFEDNLRRELQYVGLLGDDEETDWLVKEDDDVSAELRRLQRELKAQVEINTFRKKRLLDVVDRQLQYEQYRQVTDVLDTQVEQHYAKRYRAQKSKKKKSSSSIKTSLSESTLNAMEKRKAWVNEIGKIFADKNLVMPTTSIYSKGEDGENTL